jgi:hypothetical protein
MLLMALSAVMLLGGMTLLVPLLIVVIALICIAGVLDG